MTTQSMLEKFIIEIKYIFLGSRAGAENKT